MHAPHILFIRSRSGSNNSLVFWSTMESKVKPSKVFVHFEIPEQHGENYKATCAYCNVGISVTGKTTSNMMTHLKSKSSQSQNYFIEPYTMNMQISFFSIKYNT